MSAAEDRTIIWFDHGLGDCCQLARILDCYTRLGGYQFAIHCPGDKRLVFEAIGAAWTEKPDRSTYHRWPYHPDYNRPDPLTDGPEQKFWHSLHAPLPPPPGGMMDFYRILCAREPDGRHLLTEAVKEDCRRWLDGLPRPVILIHGKGTNFAAAKNLPDQQYAELVARLLDETGAGIVLLDWDNRDPYWPHSRVRHLKRHFGHIDLPHLLGLMCEAGLLIGIDSGPYHFAAFQPDLPVIGYFRSHCPSAVSLPRRNTAALVGSRWQTAARIRRRRWNLIECPENDPTIEDLLWCCRRALHGRRYCRDFGSELQLAWWIERKLRPSAENCWRGRADTFSLALSRLRGLASPTIVETGTIRQQEEWSAGYSTYLFAAWLDGHGRGKLLSIDHSKEACQLAKTELVAAGWQADCTIIEAESATYLRQQRNPIDLLFLDSSDDPQQAMRELSAAENLLGHQAMILIDDTAWDRGWNGKGALVVPYLLERGWSILKTGYQVLLARHR